MIKAELLYQEYLLTEGIKKKQANVMQQRLLYATENRQQHGSAA